MRWGLCEEGRRDPLCVSLGGGKSAVHFSSCLMALDHSALNSERLPGKGPRGTAFSYPFRDLRRCSAFVDMCNIRKGE